ncbi:MAG: excinuclease ABC subunit UvrA [Parcubacteria group bacterium]|nr:excinuclease ABC subunit UvrA [Parcubacteria group bacterium]
MKDKIIIKGAKVHNLKNIDLELPKNKLIVFTGVSGSGKSSLAFDTIFAEGQRRYVESLSPYARQFLGQMDAPDVEEITGLSPAIAIDQKGHSHNPRSTVATLTEIYDYMRVLFARIGKPFCPNCGGEIKKLSPQEMIDTIIELADGKPITILAPVVRGRKGEYYQLLYNFLSDGFSKARIDGKFHSLHDRINLSRYKNHNIDLVVDKVLPDDVSRVAEAVDTALEYGEGLVGAIFAAPDGGEPRPKGRDGGRELLLSSKWSCTKDDFSFQEIEPRLFSFNSPYGACENCHGLGREFIYSEELCSVCNGKRLKKESLSVKVKGKNIAETADLTIDKAYEFFVELEDKLKANEKEIAKTVLKEIISRLGFLLEVGLDYIALSREAGSLSGGESQRIRLASQIGSKLSGTLYVLDEPTIGLHERDNERLLKTLKDLRDMGNTVIVVEHDEKTIRDSDYFVDLGPGPGRHGGEVVVADETNILLKKNYKTNSLTLKYLKDEEKIEIPELRRKSSHEKIKIIGATANNLKNINIDIPLRRLICVTGVSGSGKSTLVFDILKKCTRRGIDHINKETEGVAKVLGFEYLDSIIEVDQSPIGRTPRSNPATYTGVFSPIRDLFASLPEAKEKGYGISRFSFNRPGGRCESCEGAGHKLIEMHFLPPVLVTCDVCRGKRFNNETLEVKYKNKNIFGILDMTVEEALKIFEDIYTIADKLKVLNQVGLGYIKLGQSATTLSGGEAQRIKLAKHLARPMHRRSLFLLDEPTTGLHFEDIKMLLKVLDELVKRGNTVVVIEHNLHVIKCADYIIDLGPEGGDKGGKVVAYGTPEEVAKNKNSYTGQYLKKVLFEN